MAITHKHPFIAMLMKALDIPPTARWFELRVAVNEAVMVRCGYYPKLEPVDLPGGAFSYCEHCGRVFDRGTRGTCDGCGHTLSPTGQAKAAPTYANTKPGTDVSSVDISPWNRAGWSK